MKLFRTKNRKTATKDRNGSSADANTDNDNDDDENSNDNFPSAPFVTGDQPARPMSPPTPEKPRYQTQRPTLHRMTSSLASYRATPITKHYALNNQILVAFENHYANNHYTVAYAIGLQFVETALLEIPKHGYFYSSRHATERMTNSLDAIRVSNMLERILEHQQTKPNGEKEFGGMDLGAELVMVRKLNALAVELASEASFEQYEKQRAQIEAEIHEMKKRDVCSTVLVDTCGPLLESVTETICPPGGIFQMPFSTSRGEERQPTLPADRQYEPKHDQGDRQQQQYEPQPDQGDGQERAPMPVPPPLSPMKERSMSAMMRQIMQQDESSCSTGVAKLDPPELRSRSILAPPPPQLSDGWTVLPHQVPERPEFGRQMSGRSYADHVALERALYLSGLEVQPGGPYEDTRPSAVSSDPLQRDDDEWMLEHALKESEREMERLKEQEERQLLEVFQKSQEEQNMRQQMQFQRAPSQPQLQRRVTKTQLETETLLMLYHEDFMSLWDSGRIRITHVGTYQGRLKGSINGCTVIAPLLCIHHFINFSEPSSNGHRQNDPGLPDETIKNVIDEEVPSILPKVREELGVVQDAFLIPSDSHDYLIKNQLLSQQQFVTVIGGNILDERHLHELVRTIQCGAPQPKKGSLESDDDAGENETEKDSVPDRRFCKIGCTLFFHEHVVSILKLQRAQDGKAWYDIIDSLPNKGMLSREVGSTLRENGSGGDGSGTVVSANPIIDPLGFGIPEIDTPLDTARIRCLDEEALTAAIRWYACSKFNAENLHYIDNYPWDDLTTDFDPRVFQAFVWSEAAD